MTDWAIWLIPLTLLVHQIRGYRRRSAWHRARVKAKRARINDLLDKWSRPK